MSYIPEKGLTLRQARRLVEREVLAMERKRAPRSFPHLAGLGDAQQEFLSTTVNAYIDKLLCVACLKPCDTFVLITGSNDFCLGMLKDLGARASEALALATRDKDQLMRQIPVCPPCAGKSKVTTVSYAEVRLQAGGDPLAPVHVPVIAENAEYYNATMKILDARREAEDKQREKQEEYEMRIKGAQKDVADFFQNLEKGRVDGISALGYLTDISNGHIKVYHGEPGRAVASDGRFVTTISLTPRNAHRTVQNARGKIAQWEKANLQPADEPVITEDDEMPREYRTWTDAEKAAIVTRFDYADEPGQRALLDKHRIQVRDIARFREYLPRHGWNIPPEPVPPEDDLNRSQACETCGTDKALTRRNFTQEKVLGKWRWAKKCSTCEGAAVLGIEPVAETAPAAAAAAMLQGAVKRHAEVHAEEDILPVAEEPKALDNSEATRMIALMGRKRDINARLAVIDAEKAAKVKDLEEQMARLTRELDEEKKRLSTERDQVETELLELVSG